jgi:hypothetical protein
MALYLWICAGRGPRQRSVASLPGFAGACCLILLSFASKYSGEHP